MMAKDEVFMALVGLFGGLCGWVVKQIYQSVNKSENRIGGIEKNIVDRSYLESQLGPIRAQLNLILGQILEHRKTEDKENG